MNVVVAEQPTLSYIPVRPKPLVNAVLGMVTALFLGLCAVYLAEAGRNTVATPRELEAASQYPVLATLSIHSPQIGEVVEGTAVEAERALASIMVRSTRPPDMFSYR